MTSVFHQSHQENRSRLTNAHHYSLSLISVGLFLRISHFMSFLHLPDFVSSSSVVYSVYFSFSPPGSPTTIGFFPSPSALTSPGGLMRMPGLAYTSNGMKDIINAMQGYQVRDTHSINFFVCIKTLSSLCRSYTSAAQFFIQILFCGCVL